MQYTLPFHESGKPLISTLLRLPPSLRNPVKQKIRVEIIGKEHDEFFAGSSILRLASSYNCQQ
jgi:hypothetical protein